MGRRAAYAIVAVTGRGLSPPTVWMAGHGHKELSAKEFADYISVLDITPADLSVVTGMDLPAPFPQRPPGTAEMARRVPTRRSCVAEAPRAEPGGEDPRSQVYGIGSILAMVTVPLFLCSRHSCRLPEGRLRSATRKGM